MSSNDIKNSFDKHKNLAFIICLILICFDLYYYFFYTFVELGIHHPFLNKLVHTVVKTGLYNHPIYSNILILVLTAMFILLDKGKKDLDLNPNTVLTLILTSTVLFLLTSILPEYIDSLPIFSLIYISSYLYVVKTYSYFSRLLNTDLMKDRFNKKNKIFPQLTELIENDMSVNIPYKFISNYKKNELPVYTEGYINLIAPERASMILGKPGSGKSYSFVEEIIKQHIMKGFAMINYDYKFPTLTNVAYNYYKKYESSYDKYENKVNFAIINLDKPEYSHRCNPVSRDLITTKAQAADAVYTLFFNIDKKSATKQDFFQMSAMAITSATLWFLRMYQNGKYCSLPHLIEFINRSDEEILKILDNYKELRYFTSSFADALKKESFEQLSGQTASARIPLGKCATDEMFWVMAPDEGEKQVDLRVNRIENVTILNVANNPDTQKTNGPALGLFMSQAAKFINNHDRVPCDFLVDELPTIYINGLNTLIATARSNKVCTVLSFQDYSQLVNEYGREQADTIYNTTDNIICGKVATDTAEKISKSIGKINYQSQSYSINKDSTSTSFNTQREYVVPPEDISQFSQGEFVGIVSDTYRQPIELKTFRGIVSPDKSDLENEHCPLINPTLTTETLREHTNKIRKHIDDIIESELYRIEKNINAEVEQAEQEANQNDEYGFYNQTPDDIDQLPYSSNDDEMPDLNNNDSDYSGEDFNSGIEGENIYAGSDEDNKLNGVIKFFSLKDNKKKKDDDDKSDDDKSDDDSNDFSFINQN